MKKRLFIASMLGLFTIAACSSDNSEDEHVWKEQTDTIDKARSVEQTILQSYEDNKKKMDGTND